MAHIWLRAETRDGERRTGLTPEGASRLILAGHRVTVEDFAMRVIPTSDFVARGCAVAPAGSWVDAPGDAIIFGLKELPEDSTPLRHRHIMFGHAFKGQADGPALLRRFRDGGGRLYDLEYLVDQTGRRIAAFGYWAGFAGAAMGVDCWLHQQESGGPGPARGQPYPGRNALVDALAARLGQRPVRPSMIVIGALGRVGSGASALADALGLPLTRWDMAETAHGGPFPEILNHDIFVNCILAAPGVPVFVPASAMTAPRKLSVVADVSCDPSSDYNPIPIYDAANSFSNPVTRVHDAPPLDVTAIDNLPSMLPLESSQDYAGQLLPYLVQLDAIDSGVWARARAVFDDHVTRLET